MDIHTAIQPADLRRSIRFIECYQLYNKLVSQTTRRELKSQPRAHRNPAVAEAVSEKLIETPDQKP